jgi:hypothetical protein
MCSTGWLSSSRVSCRPRRAKTGHGGRTWRERGREGSRRGPRRRGLSDPRRAMGVALGARGACSDDLTSLGFRRRRSSRPNAQRTMGSVSGLGGAHINTTSWWASLHLRPPGREEAGPIQTTFFERTDCVLSGPPWQCLRVADELKGARHGWLIRLGGGLAIAVPRRRREENRHPFLASDIFDGPSASWTENPTRPICSAEKASAMILGATF